MTYLRHIINGRELGKVIPLPKEFKNKKLEIIVFAVDESEDKIKLVQRLRGAYKGRLSSTEEFSRQKAKEKKLEERYF